jgi:hypothetical protein
MQFFLIKMHVFLLYKPEFLWWWQNYMVENSTLAELYGKIWCRT